MQNKNKKYYLGPLYPNVYFSHRQAQCVILFLKGLSNSKVGHALNLSAKTIDSYTVDIRMKLNCKSKKQLIAKIKKTNFLMYVNELIGNTTDIS